MLGKSKKASAKDLDDSSSATNHVDLDRRTEPAEEVKLSKRGRSSKHGTSSPKKTQNEEVPVIVEEKDHQPPPPSVQVVGAKEDTPTTTQQQPAEEEKPWKNFEQQFIAEMGKDSKKTKMYLASRDEVSVTIRKREFRTAVCSVPVSI